EAEDLAVDVGEDEAQGQKRDRIPGPRGVRRAEATGSHHAGQDAVACGHQRSSSKIARASSAWMLSPSTRSGLTSSDTHRGPSARAAAPIPRMTAARAALSTGFAPR